VPLKGDPCATGLAQVIDCIAQILVSVKMLYLCAVAGNIRRLIPQRLWPHVLPTNVGPDKLLKRLRVKPPYRVCSRKVWRKTEVFVVALDPAACSMAIVAVFGTATKDRLGR